MNKISIQIAFVVSIKINKKAIYHSISLFYDLLP